MGQHAGSHVSILEATELRRQLAEANPDAYLSFFGETLGNLSISQGNLGCNEEALATSTEVVTIMHRLVESDPRPFNLISHQPLEIMRTDFSRLEGSGGPGVDIGSSRDRSHSGEPESRSLLPDVAWSLNRKTRC